MATDPDDFLGRPPRGWRLATYRVVFESDTRAGRLFDILLIAAILLSVGVVVADSVAPIHARHHRAFERFEWFFTAVFTLEYLARLASVQRPMRYALSFFGIVDLLALLPTYLALIFPELHALIDVRVLRLLRVFRIFKLTAYLQEYQALGLALQHSRRKIMVFLSAVLMIVLIAGTVMYVVEGPEHGFTNIPTGIYWAITTMTTVGFGDIAPKTGLGRLISSAMMLLGWGTLAVPTGIVTAEMTARRFYSAPADGTGGPAPAPRGCDACGAVGHRPGACYCMQCGAGLAAVAAAPGRHPPPE
jgi:voltage-gated potassium channel